ncbi:homeobox-containing protein 1-like [Ptychodera flava]|uniref:homeobox-containing protein 1-like n=1 Tax=Ptychodera flava TaxID=63121 RepID=UPI00396A4115
MEPRYTMEQVYLLRRLRKSGMTKEEIIHALDTMERLDQEFDGRFGSVRSPPVGNHGNMPKHPDNRNSVANQLNSTHGNMTSRSNSSVESQNQTLYIAVDTYANNPGLPQDSSPSYRANSEGMNGAREATWSTIGGTGNRDNSAPSAEDEEVTELIRKGTLAVKEEIKQFMADRKISQCYVSQKTGISQSYISLFLVQGIEMKSHTQRLLYQWYVHEKKGIPFKPAMYMGSKSQSKSTPEDVELATNATPDKADKTAPPSTGKKRERFVWKDACIPILEKYFQQNQYPDDYEREVISDACNSVIQIPGYELPGDKLVTPVKVYNWFCNKRKDLKRRKHIAEMEAASNMNEMREIIPTH